MSAVFAVIAAAGSGQRMGGGMPRSKVLETIAGKTVIVRAIEPFIERGIRCVVLVRESECADFESVLSKFSGVSVQLGGRTRGESVWRGISYLRSACALNGDDTVLIHDGARCLISSALIDRVVEAAQRCGAAVPGLPVTDTLKELGSDDRVGATVDRSQLCAVQTPQGFRADLLIRAYSEGDFTATDDAGLVERIAPVSIVEGDRMNIKITYPEDIELAESLLSLRERRSLR